MCGRLKMLLALPVLALLSSLWSAKPSQTLVGGAVFLIFTLFAFYICTRFDAGQQLDLIMMTGALTLAASLVLVILAPRLSTSPVGWTGIFSHKQNCAAVSALLLVTALHWNPVGLAQKLSSLLIAGSSLVLLIMSQSRTGWALCIFALFLLSAIWFIQRIKSKDALLLAFAVVPPGTALVLGLYHFKSSLLHAGGSSLLRAVGKDPTFTQRTIIWAAAWHAIGKHPLLGYGYAGFWDGTHGPSLNIVLVAGWLLAQAQDGYLDLWLQLGTIGIVAFALLIGQALRNAIVSLHVNGLKIHARWSVVVIVCTLIYNIGETSMLMPQLVWVLFLVAVIGLSEGVHATKGLHLAAEEPQYAAYQ